jgi:hypothetical protein
MVGVDDRPTVVLEHVALYRSDGARRYLGELRRALPTCAEPRWTRLATGIAGDESLLLGLREYVDHAQASKFTVVLVARVERVLVVVADTGWETGRGTRISCARSEPRRYDVPPCSTWAEAGGGRSPGVSKLSRPLAEPESYEHATSS